MEDILGVEPRTCSLSLSTFAVINNYLLHKHCRLIRNGWQNVVPCHLIVRNYVSSREADQTDGDTV